MTDQEYFNSICPYTNKHCDLWNCEVCEVEKQEREWLNSIEEAENE